MRSQKSLIPRVSLVLVVLLAVVAVTLAGSSDEAESASRMPAAKAVRVDQVIEADESPGLWFPGVSRAARRARLSFSIAGRLLERRPSEGDRVTKGALLARLDVREQTFGARAANATVAEAEVRLAEARRDLARVEKLADQDAATREELESMAAVVDSAAAAVEAARARQSDAERRQGEGVLHAPFDGTVTEVFAEPGEYTPAGRAVLEVAGEGAVEVLLDVPESVIAGLAVGDEVAVRSALLGASHGIGRIATIAGAGGARGSLFPVVVSLGSDIPVGSSVEIELRAGKSGRMTVPVEAVVDPAGVGPAIFRLEPGSRGSGGESPTVRRVPVAVGALIAGRVVVIGDLEAGDEVVVAGQRGLLEGDSVEVIR